jgi:signal transduction histidine kinase
MVHLESVLGAEATELMLRGMSDLASLRISVFVLDPTGRDPRVSYVRPVTSPLRPYKISSFCSYLHELPGGLELCQACDLKWGWRILDERWTKVRRYECHMGLSEFGITVEAGGDLVDPIVWGEIRHVGTSVEQHLDTLRERAEQAIPGAGAEITDEHLQELCRLASNILEVEKGEADHLCERLTSGTRGLQHLLRTEHYIARTLHQIKSSLSLSRGAIDRLISMASGGGHPDDTMLGLESQRLRDRYRRVEEGIEGAALAIDEFERSRRALAVSRRAQSPNWHPVREIVERAARRIRAEAAQRNIEVRVHGPTGDTPRTCYVYADWEDMAELLDLLLDNAMKYSYRERTIDISWQTRPSAPAILPAGQQPSDVGEWLEITIDNFGLQIHPDDKDAIFVPGGRGRLFDPRRSIRGAGMGLSIALEIVRQHDSYLNVWCQLFDDPSQVVRQPSGGFGAPPGKVNVTVGLPRERWSEVRF